MQSQLAEKVIDVYGGRELWEKSQFIVAEVSVTGLAFILKRRPYFNNAKIKLDIHKPFSKLTPIGKNPLISGVLDGHNVHLENEEGLITVSRENPRKYFPYRRRLLYWDDLDMSYFANYAFWNYFTFPNLFMNENIEWVEKSSSSLEAHFPDSLPTHSKIQEFHFDPETGRLIQHDYTADVMSKLAKVANIVLEHNETDGIIYPSARRVIPRRSDGTPMNGPIMIDIKVHNFRFI